jgi:trimeric autotransporter adhesin
MKNVHFCIVVICLLFTGSVLAQVKIGDTPTTINSNSLLELETTNKGLLLPRIALTSTISASPLSAHVAGMSVYNTATISDVTPGYYYDDGTKWLKLGASFNSWNITGNASTIDGTNFLGTTDNVPLNFRVNNINAGKIDQTKQNVFFGYQSGNSISTGIFNTGIGHGALINNTSAGFNVAIGNSALGANTTGQGNTAIGYAAMLSNTTSGFNTAIGFAAMQFNTAGTGNSALGTNALNKNTTGNFNSAFGQSALQNTTTGNSNTGIGHASLAANTSGNYNSALGQSALGANTTGTGNTAFGYGSLYTNTTASYNVALGYGSLYGNTTGGSNIGVGFGALYSNKIGDYNCAEGYAALYNNTTGIANMGYGYAALYNNTTGSHNIGMGYNALQASNTSYNTVVGNYGFSIANTGVGNSGLGYYVGNALSYGDYNTFIGYQSYGTASGINQTSVGYLANNANGNNTVQLGNTTNVGVYAYGGFFTLSDATYKKNISQNVPGLSFINKLSPVTYNYDITKLNKDVYGKTDISAIKDATSGKEKITYSGFLAQQVEKTADSIGYNFSGISKPKTENGHYSIDYAAFVPSLVKAIQEQQVQIEELKLTVKELQNRKL